MLLAVLGALVCACGGGNGNGADAGPSVDYSAPFVGTWTGTLTLTDPTSGQVIDSQGGITQPIVETATNTLELADFCGDNSGPIVTVTSATQFQSTTPLACPPTAVTGCNSVVFTYSAITGLLSGTTLSFQGAVALAGCSQSVTANISFSSPGPKM